jgi:hypothetical protein
VTTQYTPILKLALPVTGELSGTWGTVVNDNITSMVEQAVAGLSTINTWTANSHTLTTADGTSSEARCAMLVLATGAGGTALTAAGEVICPAASKLYVVKNGSAYAVTVKTSAGTGVAIPAGDTAFVFCDGTNVNACVTTIVNGHISGNLTVDGNTTLGDATSDTITATARFNTDLLPSTDNARDLGSSGNSWRTLYCDTSVLTPLVTATNLQVTNIKANDGTAVAVLTDSTGALDISKAVTFSATTQNISLGASQTTGTFVLGGTAATGAITLDGSTKTHTLNVGSGATENALTKTINIGTGGVSGSTTTITIGSSNGTTTTFNGTVNVTTLDLTNLEVTNIKAKDGTASITLADSTGVATFSANPILNAGTANGVVYLNASKVATSGTALTFDGSNLTVTGNMTVNGTNGYNLQISGGNAYRMYATANDLVFRSVTAGSDVMTLTYGGNVGIGTSSPDSKLTVSGGGSASSASGGTVARFVNSSVSRIDVVGGNTGFSLLEFSRANLTAAGQVAYDHTANAMYFTTNGTTERMRLTSTGTLNIVGAGTAGSTQAISFNGSAPVNSLVVTSAGDVGIGLSSPGAKLHVVGSIRYTSDIEIADSGGTVRGYIFGSSSGNTYRTNSGLSHFWQNSGTTQLTLDASGNLGLGVTPSAWSDFTGFQVGGLGAASIGGLSNNVFFASNAYYGSGQFRYAAAASTVATIYRQTVGQHIWINAAAGTAGNVITPIQAMTLDASGNLVIGNTSANTKLEIAGNNTGLTANNTLRFTDLDTSTEANQQIGKIEFYSSDSSGSGANVKAYIGAFAEDTTPDGYLAFATGESGAATERARITSAGNLLFGQDVVIGQNTADGSDSRAVYLCGGAEQTVGRGANIRVYGNEYSGEAGNTRIFSGNIANSEISLNAYTSTSVITLLTNNTERARITSGGYFKASNSGAYQDSGGTFHEQIIMLCMFAQKMQVKQQTHSK